MNEKVSNIIKWLLIVPVSLMFLVAASGKFSFSGNMHENFLRWGYSGVLLITVGVMEGLGALFLFVSSLRTYGAILLLAVMTGAVYTHFANFAELGWPLLPGGIGLVLGGILFLHRTSDDHEGAIETG